MNTQKIKFLIIFFVGFAMLNHRPLAAQESKIQLFIYQNCPYCKKVINFIKQIGHMADVELIDASQAINQKKLKNISGDSQCPYLVDSINNVSMAESADIIEYLKKRFNQI